MKIVSIRYKSLCVFFLLFQFESNVFAQSLLNKYPKVGEHFPAFILNDLHYFNSTKVNSETFLGKPLIIDFFSVGCEGCFASFPHLNNLKKEFDGRVQFVLIAKNSPGLQKQYEKYMKHYSLDMPVDYDDSTIWNQFGVYQVPYTLMIDSAGIIRQITIASELNTDVINKFLLGKSQKLFSGATQFDLENENAGFVFYDRNKPFLLKGNGGVDSSYGYRSILTSWDPRCLVYMDLFISKDNKNKADEIGITLSLLYRLAYGDTVNAIVPPSDLANMFGPENHYGQWANLPVVESSRKRLFDDRMYEGENTYSYSLQIPDSIAGAANLQAVMRNDLKSYFHFDVKIETRKWPTWDIIVKKDAVSKLKTKGGDPVVKGDFYSMTIRNKPLSSLLELIWGYNQHDTAVFLDKTGINFNIDLDMNCIWTDFNDIKRELNKNGLDIVRGETEVKVIVIRDGNQEVQK